MTVAMKAWIQINGWDRRGSAPYNNGAQGIIDKHGGKEYGGGWRFRDGSVLLRARAELFAPDPTPPRPPAD